MYPTKRYYRAMALTDGFWYPIPVGGPDTDDLKVIHAAIQKYIKECEYVTTQVIITEWTETVHCKIFYDPIQVEKIK